jgi:hypothetical protein
MAWDSTRPIPWQRLLREWAIYGSILAVVIFIARRNDLQAGQFVWLILSFPIYIGFGALLAKFGYQRKTLKDLRAETARRNAEASSVRSVASSTTGRPKPAPTKRTSTGPGSRTSNRPGNRSKGKRR